jgi:hypothetical protein
MALIYIDTNIYIGIYESLTEPLAVIDELAVAAKYLVIPEQTVREFERNRLSALNKLIEDFEKSVRFQPFCTSLTKHYPEFQELTEKLKAARVVATSIIKRLENAREVANDSVAKKIQILFESPVVKRLPTTDAIFNAAHRRKLLGEPPFSKSKATIGDEIIWETLLSGTSDNLVLVSKDRGFHDHAQLLAFEYEKRTGYRLLEVTTNISEALKSVGKTPSPKLVEQEKLIDPEECCPKCGKAGRIFGFEGSDGDEACWFECPDCGVIDL